MNTHRDMENADLKDLLEEDLREAWHFQREAQFRRKQKTIWSTIDCYRTVLDDGVNASNRLCCGFYNKCTAFYWEQSAQYGRYDEKDGFGCTPGIVFAAMYEAWQGHREYGHFIANPVRITPRGPKNLKEIVEAHKQLCTIARERMLVLDDQHYRVHNLYAALLLVCDRREFEGSEADSEGFYRLSGIARMQSVLIVRTGAECSIPFSFDRLRQHALPLQRSDASGMDVIRVPLYIAVEFFADLEKASEESRDENDIDTSLCGHTWPKTFDKSVRNHPETWVHALLSAFESGLGDQDGLRDITEALSRIEARQAGKTSVWDFDHIDWAHSWRS